MYGCLAARHAWPYRLGKQAGFCARLLVLWAALLSALAPAKAEVRVGGDGSLVRTFEGHAGGVWAVAFSPDGRTVLSGSEDKTVRIWDAATGSLQGTLIGATGEVTSIAVSPDGRTAVGGGRDGTLLLWNIASGRLIGEFAGHSKPVWAVAFSPDGRTVLSGGLDRTMKLWDVATYGLLRTFSGFPGAVRSVAFSPDGRTILGGSNNDTLKTGSLRSWDVDTGRLLTTFEEISTVFSVAFSPDGQTAISSRGSDVGMWEMGTGRLLHTFKGHSSTVWTVAFSPDGRSLLSGSWDRSLRQWDVATLRVLRTFEGHAGSIRSVAFAPDGRAVLSGAADKTVKLWSLAAAPNSARPGQLPFSLDGPADLVDDGLPSKRLEPPAASLSAPTASKSELAASLGIPATPESPSQAAQNAATMFGIPLTQSTPPQPRPSAAAVPASPPVAAAPSHAGSAPLVPERRVALVIGNSAYGGMPRLPNPARDAQSVASALRQVGFSEVIEVSDLSRAGMIASLNAFSDKVANADWAMVYYAGHGMELNGVNYLIPVDAKLLSDRDVPDEAIALDRVLSGLSSARKLRLVVLDACRNNPFDARMARTAPNRAVTRGLAPVEPGGSTLVVYAAKHGQVALDGDGSNSPFVTALTKHITTPRLEVDKMFRRVAADVLRSTGNRQEPYTYGRLPEDDLYFAAR